MTTNNLPLECISTRDAARMLGLHSNTLKRWRAEGCGPRFLTLNGRTIRYRAADLEAYCLESTLCPTNLPRSF